MRSSLWLLRIGAGAAAVAIASRLSVLVPGTDVPQSAQTLAVLLVGALLGARDGSLALITYIVVGGLGLPVFADGGSGWSHVVGPTGGYLVGFVVAAGAVGLARTHGLFRRFGLTLAVMLAAHTLILLVGWAWLASSTGPAAAYEGGVAPFLLGGIAKSVIAAVIVLPLTVTMERAAATDGATQTTSL